jgi:hypothetical protein
MRTRARWPLDTFTRRPASQASFGHLGLRPRATLTLLDLAPGLSFRSTSRNSLYTRTMFSA